MSTADAVFVLSERRFQSPSEADSRTILRYWSIRDVAPDVHVYVQILLPENLIHTSAQNTVGMCYIYPFAESLAAFRSSRW